MCLLWYSFELTVSQYLLCSLPEGLVCCGKMSGLDAGLLPHQSNPLERKGKVENLLNPVVFIILPPTGHGACHTSNFKMIVLRDLILYFNHRRIKRL